MGACWEPAPSARLLLTSFPGSSRAALALLLLLLSGAPPFLCCLGPEMQYLHISFVYVFQRSWNKLSNVAERKDSGLIHLETMGPREFARGTVTGGNQLRHSASLEQDGLRPQREDPRGMLSALI